mmetsp:Transcript_61515/g.164747  ORF Transcript_61515/g.164747 Transcript_61515/m.164747 type:complete len:223 (-) Transcript_61515:100-768(-)
MTAGKRAPIQPAADAVSKLEKKPGTARSAMPSKNKIIATKKHSSKWSSQRTAAPSTAGTKAPKAAAVASSGAEGKFKALALQLPPAPKPLGNYKPLVTVGKLVYLSGHGPVKEDSSRMVGRVGLEATEEEGYEAAKQTGLAMLSTLKSQLGSLDTVKRVVKLFGMVNCVEDFTDHPKVINGCSDLFAKVWGSQNGVGARSAVGMGSLPNNISVEIEGVFELM